MANANQRLYDASVRHQVHLYRFAEGEARRLTEILREAEQDLLDRITVTLSRRTVSQKRLEELYVSMKTQRAKLYKAMGQDMTKSLERLASVEANWERTAIAGASPITLNMAAVPIELIRGVAAAPIQGIPLVGWLNKIEADEVLQLERAVRLSVLEGQTIDELVQRIRGTRANNFNDGILGTSTRNATALARTAVNHVSNAARQEVWNANSDIVKALRWTATLDGRTSDICASRDGALAPVTSGGSQPAPTLEGVLLSPPDARPPAHFQCRSLMVAVLDGVALSGTRPFIKDTRTRAKREAAFRREAKERGVPIGKVRREWADKNVGSVPATTNYQDWLKNQPRNLQDEVLGKKRAEMFRNGTPAERFFDRSGRKLSLDELQAELASDALNVAEPTIGQVAKGMLMSGASNDDVLSAIRRQFPDAKTSKSSVATYKSQLKAAGLLSFQNAEVSSRGTVGANIAMATFERHLEETLPNVYGALGRAWAEIEPDLEGSPGVYAYYRAGEGVQISQRKLDPLSYEQSHQIIAHELGHMLIEDYGLPMPRVNTVVTNPEIRSLFSYYLGSQDEIKAEVLAFAMTDSMVTSQGLSGLLFKSIFRADIKKAQRLLQNFENTPQAYAIALLRRGFNEKTTLRIVKKAFPEGKTSIAMVKSWRSGLNIRQLEASAAGSAAVVATKAPKPYEGSLPTSLELNNSQAIVRYQLLQGKIFVIQRFEDGSEAKGSLEPDDIPFDLAKDGWYDESGQYLGGDPIWP